MRLHATASLACATALPTLAAPAAAPQIVPTGSPLFSLAWSERLKLLVAGGHSILHIFRVDVAEATRLRHAHHVAQGSSDRATAAAAALSAAKGPGPAAAQSAGATAASASGDRRPVLVRACPAFRGWSHPSAGAARRCSTSGASSNALGLASHPGSADSAAQAVDGSLEATQDTAEDGGSEAGTAPASTGRPCAAASAGVSEQVVLGQRDAREEDYYSACHTDVVKCIVITDGGKIFTAG